MANKAKDYFCIFGGGGIRGAAYAGALRSIEENKINITGCAGSSVGSIVACLYGIGYSACEIEEIFMNFSPDIFRDINFDIIKGIGFSKGELFLSWMKELVEKKYYGEKYVPNGNNHVKFKDIDKDIVILSVNLTDSSFKEFSRKKTPDFEIVQAVRASVSMPGLFKPVQIGDEIFVDGDLMKSWPLWRLSENLCPEDSRILEFRLEDMEENKKIENPLVYINAVYNTVTNFATDFVMDLYGKRDKFDYIKLNLKNISVVDFMITKEKKKELIDIGYQMTTEYFKEFLPKKKKDLVFAYNSIYSKLLEFDSVLSKLQIEKADYKLGDLFIELSEFEQFIDRIIYKKIIELKDIFKQNLKSQKILFLNQKLTLQNYKLVKSKTIETVSVLKEKLSEFVDSIH